MDSANIEQEEELDGQGEYENWLEANRERKALRDRLGF